MNFWIKFWEKHPLLFFGLNFLFSTLVISFSNFTFLFPWILLWLPFKKLFFKSAIIIPLAIALSYSVSLEQKKPLSPYPFKVHSIDTLESRFSQNFYIYKGSIGQIEVSTLSASSKLFTPGFAYRVYGDLEKSEYGNYQLKLNKNYKIKEISIASQMDHLRFKAHHHFKTWIEKKCHSKESSAFIYGLATGKFSDRLLKFLFSKYQLIHLLVISGFHLSLLCIFIFKTLSLFCGKRTSVIFSLVFLGAYLLFLGFSPSLFRAYCSASILLLGLLFGKKAIGLNSLGAALIASLIIDPKLVLHLGFQFSFLVTASILYFFPIIRSQFKTQSKGMKYLIDLISLSISVQLISLPISLLYFHKASLIGLFLNLWVPLLFTAFLYLLVITLSLSFIPILNQALFYLSECFSKGITELVYLPWMNFDISLRSSYLTPELIIIWISLLFFFATLYRSKHRSHLSLNI